LQEGDVAARAWSGKVAEFSDETMLQIIDFERFLLDRMNSSDRKALYRWRHVGNDNLSKAGP
jgi:hypothetical protein